MKSINFLGDSITEGACLTRHEDIYSAIVCKKLNVKENNYGVSGTRIARQTNPTVECPSFDEDYVIRAERMDYTADFTFVFGGTNDFGHGDAPLGEMGDETPYTFYGGLANLFNFLLERTSADKICFILPLHRVNDETPYGEFKKTPVGSLKDYNDIIKEVCKKYGIDTLEIKNLPTNVPAGASEYFADGLHPNEKGHQVLASEVLEYLNNKKW